MRFNSLFPAVRLDLVDIHGQLATLSDHPTDYASSFLQGRRTYILIKITSKVVTEIRLVSASILDQRFGYYYFCLYSNPTIEIFQVFLKHAVVSRKDFLQLFLNFH